jgi:WD40 repeat protein
VLATAGANRAVTLWDVPAGRKRGELHGRTGPVWATAFSPDGARLASGGADQVLRLWDVEAGQEVLALRGTLDVTREALSPDGRRVVAAEPSIKVWETQARRGSGRCLHCQQRAARATIGQPHVPHPAVPSRPGATR